MLTTEYNLLRDRLARVRELLMTAPEAQDPRNAEALSNWADRLEALVLDADADRLKGGDDGDHGLSQLIGLGPTTSTDLGDVDVPLAVEDYEDTVDSERVQAMADLYYVFQHEKIGVFRA